LEPQWDQQTVLFGIQHHVDANSDQRITEDEFANHDYASPGFAEIDQNNDGQLDSDEIHRLMLESDPLMFDNQPPLPAVPRSAAAAYQTLPDDVRMLHDLFVFLQVEIIATNIDFEEINHEKLLVAAQTRRLQSPQSLDVLKTLRQGYHNADMTFPPRLSAMLDASP